MSIHATNVTAYIRTYTADIAADDPTVKATIHTTHFAPVTTTNCESFEAT
jgi:hypothetical protein